MAWDEGFGGTSKDMSTARIISFLGWTNEKKPMFQCVDDQGRNLVIQAATHQSDYVVGGSYYVADIDNEHNYSDQRLIPLAPKNRWLLPSQLQKEFPYTLMKAYLLNDVFKKEIPGFRKDTVIGFNDTTIFLKKYGRARLYKSGLKGYLNSIKVGDEVTVGFDNNRWGSPVAYLWVKKEEELGMKKRGMIIGEEEEEEGLMVEIIPEWIIIGNPLGTLSHSWGVGSMDPLIWGVGTGRTHFEGGNSVPDPMPVEAYTTRTLFYYQIGFVIKAKREEIKEIHIEIAGNTTFLVPPFGQEIKFIVTAGTHLTSTGVFFSGTAPSGTYATRGIFAPAPHIPTPPGYLGGELLFIPKLVGDEEISVQVILQDGSQAVFVFVMEDKNVTISYPKYSTNAGIIGYGGDSWFIFDFFPNISLPNANPTTSFTGGDLEISYDYSFANKISSDAVGFSASPIDIDINKFFHNNSTYIIQRIYSDAEKDGLRKIGVDFKKLHNWSLPINFGLVGEKQYSTITKVGE